MITYTDIVAAIVSGELDDRLEAIYEVIKSRRNEQSRMKFFTFNPGDKVRFVASIRPTYLAGVTGTLRSLRSKKVVVDLDHPVGRFHKGIITPASVIEKI